jgi:hypothetical protein
MQSVKTWGGLVAVMVAVGAGLAPAGAHASSTDVVSAIKTANHVIDQTRGYKELIGKLTPKTKAQAERIVGDFTELEKVADHQVDLVAQSSTSSAKQVQGKRDWVQGSREQDQGILQFRDAFKDVIEGNEAAFKRDFVKGSKTFVTGTKLGIKGDKLLGLPSTD